MTKKNRKTKALKETEELENSIFNEKVEQKLSNFEQLKKSIEINKTTVQEIPNNIKYKLINDGEEVSVEKYKREVIRDINEFNDIAYVCISSKEKDSNASRYLLFAGVLLLVISALGIGNYILSKTTQNPQRLGDPQESSEKLDLHLTNDKEIIFDGDFDPLSVIDKDKYQGYKITAKPELIKNDGEYEVIFAFEKDNKVETKKYLVKIIDEDKPQIKIDDITLDKGDDFNPQDYITVKDSVEGKLSYLKEEPETNDNSKYDEGFYLVESNIDTTKPGTYKLEVRATDKNNNYVTKSVDVVVREVKKLCKVEIIDQEEKKEIIERVWVVDSPEVKPVIQSKWVIDKPAQPARTIEKTVNGVVTTERTPELPEQGHWEDVVIKQGTPEQGHWESKTVQKAQERKSHYEERECN